MFHLARSVANKLTQVVVRHRSVDKCLLVYLPLVNGQAVLSEEMRVKVYDRLGVPHNLPYLLRERAYVRVGKR